VAFVRTDILEECSASIIRVTRIGELGTNNISSNYQPNAAKKCYMKKEALVWNTTLRMQREVGGSR
jgi:hypothetical protein